MKRRVFLALGGVAIAMPKLASAQPASRAYRIAILDDSTDAGLLETWTGFQKRLRDLGYVEGKNVKFDSRHASGATERLPALAAELVALKPDLIATSGTPSTRAAIRATSSIPVVFVAAGDPVAAGLVASLARPGRNVTGISSMTTETGQKTLEFLLELAPDVRRIAYLSDPTNQVSAAVYLRIEENARKRKLSIQMLDGSARETLNQAFDTIRRDRIQGLLVGSSPSLVGNGEEIVKLAASEKLPAVYGRLEYASHGGLLSFGIDRAAAGTRGADLVHRILRGAKPAEMAVEQLASIRTVINMKTARALGIKIPDSIRLRADEVIE